MGDPLSPRASQNTKLLDGLKLEKGGVSYADLHSEVVKNVDNMATSSTGLCQKQRVGRKAAENEEIVKHMSNLPNYLERGENRQDKALNFGVMDWGRLEKWHYNHKQVPCKSSKYSPSSSNSSSYFSTDGSSTRSSRGHSCSPAGHKFHRPTLQSHLNASPKQVFTPFVKSSVGNLGKFQDFKDAPGNHWTEQKSTYQPFHKNQLEIKPKECRREVSYAHSIPETKSSLDLGNCRMTSSSKGKKKILDDESTKGLEKFQDPHYSNHDHDCDERDKTVVLLLPRDGPDTSHTSGERSLEAIRRSFSEGVHFEEIYHSDLYDNIPRSCPLQSEITSVEHSQIEPNSIDAKSSYNPFPAPSSARIPTCPSRSNNLEEKRSTMPSKCSDLKGSVAATKVRNLSPLRRLSIGMSKIGRNSSSGDSSAISQLSSKSVTSKCASGRAEASAFSDNSTKDNPNVSSRARSSPLRRLLDPLFPSKATNAHQIGEISQEDSKIKVKAKLDFGSCKETSVDDSLRNEKNESSTMQALFQKAVKNGRPLFTFAVDNNSDILAATMRRLNSSGKDGNSWIYTFFTIHEVKKKNGSWLNQGSKGNSHGYVPNIAAQMKVSDPPNSNLSRQDSVDQCSTGEFVLFTVDSRQFNHQISDVQPHDELAAIVVKIPRKAIKVENDLCVGSEDLFSTTVILPGGDHGLPSKGEPSTLLERWRSGGLCDCGGWDVGCRIRILANQTQACRRSSSTEVHLSNGQFELFSQGELLNERPFLSLSPLKEGIFSVEFNSSMSLLQAFSICISVLDSRKPSQLSESNNFLKEKLSEETTALKCSGTNVPNQVQEEVPVRYASYPPLSPVGRV